MLGCNEVATRAGRGHGLGRDGGRTPAAVSTQHLTNLDTRDIFRCYMVYLISYAKSFLESFQSVLKSEIVEVHQRRRLRAGSSSENCQQSSEESLEKFLVLEEF